MATVPHFRSFAVSMFVVGLCAACGSLGPVYPARPEAAASDPIADPSPSRVVLHTTVTAAGMKRLLLENLPETGEGTFRLLGKDRRYTWKRQEPELRFGQGRISVALRIDANAEVPLSSIDIPLDVKIAAEPVVTSEYVARLQALEVAVDSPRRLVKFADAAGDVLTGIQKELHKKLSDASFNLKPMAEEAFARISAPLELPVGGTKGCAKLRVMGVEAGPTVLADGVEKDFALIIAPSITLPCVTDKTGDALPPLANVASLPSGPFQVVVPVAARYDELTKAMAAAFTDGKLFFSKDYPELYLSEPEVYAAKDQIVVKLQIRGPIKKMGLDVDLNGALYLVGRPTVVDNELRVMDLEPTIETKNFLLTLKAAFDGDSIRDQARAALRLDIGERLKAVRSKLSTEVSFGSALGCVRASADKVEVSSLHVHGSYLRLYVSVTGRASAYVPCPEN